MEMAQIKRVNNMKNLHEIEGFLKYKTSRSNKRCGFVFIATWEGVHKKGHLSCGNCLG